MTLLETITSRNLRRRAKRRALSLKINFKNRKTRAQRETSSQREAGESSHLELEVRMSLQIATWPLLRGLARPSKPLTSIQFKSIPRGVTFIHPETTLILDVSKNSRWRTMELFITQTPKRTITACRETSHPSSFERDSPILPPP